MIQLVVVGGVRPPLSHGVAHYEERLSHYWKFQVDEVSAGTRSGGSAPDPRRVMEEEGERILARIPDRADLWVLTREGQPISSGRLAAILEDRRVHGAPTLTLVIGGAFGIHADVLARASRRIRLSDMTFPHEMARLILAEQLYRAGTILRGEPYHKGPLPGSRGSS